MHLPLSPLHTDTYYKPSIVSAVKRPANIGFSPPGNQLGGVDDFGGGGGGGGGGEWGREWREEWSGEGKEWREEGVEGGMKGILMSNSN